MDDGSNIEMADVERALSVVAEFVAAPGGDVYLPIFIRLERELAAMRANGSALERARAMSGANPTRARASRRAA